MLFIFLCCCEKAHDNKEFSCENSKPFCESRITTRYVEPCIYIETTRNCLHADQHKKLPTLIVLLFYISI